MYSTCRKLQKAYRKWCDQKDILKKETIQVQRQLNEGQDDSCDACEGNGGNAKTSSVCYHRRHQGTSTQHRTKMKFV